MYVYYGPARRHFSSQISATGWGDWCLYSVCDVYHSVSHALYGVCIVPCHYLVSSRRQFYIKNPNKQAISSYTWNYNYDNFCFISKKSCSYAMVLLSWVSWSGCYVPIPNLYESRSSMTITSLTICTTQIWFYMLDFLGYQGNWYSSKNFRCRASYFLPLIFHDFSKVVGGFGVKLTAG